VGALDPATIQKYVTPLVIPARMPPSERAVVSTDTPSA
jgi:hypothetical protein